MATANDWYVFVVDRLLIEQDCYLKSSQPEMAIDMLTDVMEWEQALSLAEKLAPHKTGFIARERAQQLEQTYANSVPI